MQLLMDTNPTETQTKKLTQLRHNLACNEATYNHSLNLLLKYFYKNDKIRTMLAENGERKNFFSHYIDIKKCSNSFLNDIETSWEKDIHLEDIYKIVSDHAFGFVVYTQFCYKYKHNMALLEEKLKTVEFATAVKKCEERSESELDFRQLLALPLTRLTTIHLFIRTALRDMKPDDRNYSHCKLAHTRIKQVLDSDGSNKQTIQKIAKEKSKSGYITWKVLVENSTLLRKYTMTTAEVKLTEMRFELACNEASYNYSLKRLNYYYKDEKIKAILTEREHEDLFVNIIDVKKCSDSFLFEIEKSWNENILLENIYEILLNHSDNCVVYTRYCSKYKHCRALLEQKKRSLESALKNCQKRMPNSDLNLEFTNLMVLPLNRMAVIQTLLEASLEEIEMNHMNSASCQAALNRIKQIAVDCNAKMK